MRDHKRIKEFCNPLALMCEKVTEEEVDSNEV